jgi:hypothetical protein
MIKSSINEFIPLITIIERQVLAGLKVKDELILKTILDAVRQLIIFMKETQVKS